MRRVHPPSIKATLPYSNYFNDNFHSSIIFSHRKMSNQLDNMAHNLFITIIRQSDSEYTIPISCLIYIDLD